MVRHARAFGGHMAQSGLQAAAPKKLPADIHAALVETLFGTVGSFLAGMFRGLLVPIIAPAKTHAPLFIVCTAIVVTASIFRLLILMAWKRTDPESRTAKAPSWEKLY